MDQSTFVITKITDAEFVDRVKAAIEKIGRHISAIQVNVAGVEVNADSQVGAVLTLNTFACSTIALNVSGGELVRLVRDQKELTDHVYISPKKNADDAVSFATLIGVIRSCLPDAAALTHLSVLDVEERQLFTSRQNEINEIQRIQVEFFKKFQEFALKQAEREAEARKDLEEQGRKLREAVEAEQQGMRAAADAANAELEERRRKFDSRDATHVRRELREKLHEEIKSRQARFELTQGTQRRRYEVFAVWLTVLLALLGLIYGVSSNLHLAPDGAVGAVNEGDNLLRTNKTFVTTTEYLLAYGRQTGLIITFVVTAAFFLRWLNNWFTRHAEEEFRTKRLQLDVDRASWVFETALSWKEEKDSPVPQYLIEKLSRNLFNEDEETDSSVTAADSLATALFGQSGRIKLLMSGNEVEVVRKGRTARKKSPRSAK